MEFIRYCDYFVVCCENERDAKTFLELLKQRLEKFGLEVAEDKTRVLKFGRRAWQLAEKRKENVESFNFLGFTHYFPKAISKKHSSFQQHNTPTAWAMKNSLTAIIRFIVIKNELVVSMKFKTKKL